MLKAINIKWDTDGDEEVLQSLPTEMIIPDYLEDWYGSDVESAVCKINDEKVNAEFALNEISDWLSEETGFCHDGFEIVKEVTKESVEEELFDFLTSKMKTGDAPDIERVRVFKDYLATADNGVIIDCSNGQQIRLTIQVD